MMSKEQAFEELYKAYAPQVKKLCLGYTGDLQEAEDLLQNTFASVWRKWEQFDNKAKRSTWLYRIAVNECLLSIRKSGKNKSVSLEKMPENKADEDPGEQEEAIHQLYAAISQLREAERLLIGLYLDELSYQEIAEISGLKENHVAVKIHRIKKQLTEIYKRYERV